VLLPPAWVSLTEKMTRCHLNGFDPFFVKGPLRAWMIFSAQNLRLEMRHHSLRSEKRC